MKLLFKDWITQFNEMPITNMTFQGSWGPKATSGYGYNRQDLGILENPNATEKIMRKWSNTKENFEVHFVRSEKAQEYRGIAAGEKSREWVKEELDFDVEPQPDTITIIFTQNDSNENEKVPMTAWTIAHRVGHAIYANKEFHQGFAKKIEKDFLTLLYRVYGVGSKAAKWSDGLENAYLLAYFAEKIGTMSSARNKKLGGFEEFLYELVAQYILTGKIKFNSLPKTFTIPDIGNNYFRTLEPKVIINDEKYKEFNQRLQNYAKIIEKRLDKIFSSLRNKIFVM